MRCIIDRLEVETHAHATEDLGKVIQALNNLVGQVTYETIQVQGHYGNPITVVKAAMGKASGECLDVVAKRLLSMLSDADRQLLLLSLDERMDGDKLYLRFNKQSAYRGLARLDDGGDVIKVVIHFNPGLAWGRGIKSLLEGLVRA
ncbi:MAG: RNA-binding domain-containing protein [Thermocladium sp.]|jgi:RNA binding exosome subunit